MGFLILHMMLTILMLTISFQIAHIATVDASLNALWGFDSVSKQELYFMEESGVKGIQNQIEKVSGDDKNEEKKVLIVEKFRALLGWKSPSRKAPCPAASKVAPFAPSPSPSTEPKSPAPAPALSVHVHSHPPSHHLKAKETPKKALKKGTQNARNSSVLVALLASGGVAITIVALGIIGVCLRFRNHGRKRSGKTMPISSKNREDRGKSKHAGSMDSSDKVRLSPSLELFNLDSTRMDMEPQASSSKHSPEILNNPPKENTSDSPMHEMEEQDKEPVTIEYASVSCSSTREITIVHEDSESVILESKDTESTKFEYDCVANSSSGDKIRDTDEGHSSDDDGTFHSICGSLSSVRLSNASAENSSDTLEVFSSHVSDISPSSPTSSIHLTVPMTAQDLSSATTSSNSPHSTCSPKHHMLTNSSSSNRVKDVQFSLPPPPPPLPNLHFQHSPLFSTQIASKAQSSTTLLESSSPRISSSSSGSNQTPRSFFTSSLQEPPKLQTNSVGAPPPPRPPLLKGNGASAKTPPPPPSQLPQFMPLGKGGATLPKLKPLHWDKVRAAPDRSMVWDKLRSSSFELDEEMIESLFGYNFQNSMKNEEAKSKSPSPNKHVLEPKRLQNMTILSKALNVTPEQVCDALLRGEGLCLQQLEALAKMVPTKEEEVKLSSYKGVSSELGSVERLVKAMLTVPFAFLRIEAMLYRDTFEDEVVHLRKSFLMLEDACKELRSSRLFLKLLEAVLKTGNRMNVGTIRGGAKAFKLDALLKLADVKGTDGRTTLLHFVVQEIIRAEGIKVSESIMGKLSQKNKNRTVEEKEEDYRRMGLDLVGGLSTELFNVKKTASVDLDVLANSVSNLSDGMSKLQKLLHNLTDEKSANFAHALGAFVPYAERNLKDLREDESRVLRHVQEITEYFHGDVSKEEANPLRIFVIVRDFLGMLDHVCKELRSSKLQSSPNPRAPFRSIS